MVNNLIDSICRATAKEKSRHTADTFPRAYEAAALRKSEPPFLFAFRTDAYAIRRAVYRRIPLCQIS
jgi:hypothetical protein